LVRLNNAALATTPVSSDRVEVTRPLITVFNITAIALMFAHRSPSPSNKASPSCRLRDLDNRRT
jgi:hypothetical protein